MEHIILEGSPLADYLKENEILEDIIPFTHLVNHQEPSSLLTQHFPSHQASFHSNAIERETKKSPFPFFSKWFGSLFIGQPNHGISLLLLLRHCLLLICFYTLGSILASPSTSWFNSSVLWKSLLLTWLLSMLLIHGKKGVYALYHSFRGNISHLFSLGTQSKKVDILTEWNHLCQKLLQRWNYLRELDELHQSFHFNLPSSSHATSTYHDACTHMPLRHEFLNSLRPLTMYVLQTLPSTSVSITDPELKTRLHPGPTPHLVTLKDLKYLIYELRERIPRCSEPALRECQRTFFPLLHTLTATPTGPWHLGLLSTKSLPMALYRMHVLATALEEDGLPWTFFESEWHQCLELVHHRLATFHLEGKKPTTSTSVSTSLIQPNEEKPSTIKKPSFQRKGVGPGLRSCPPSHSTDSSKMALMVDELKHVLLLRNTNVAVS